MVKFAENKSPKWRFTEISFLEAMAVLEDESRRKNLYFKAGNGAIYRVANYRGHYGRLPARRYFRRDILEG